MCHTLTHLSVTQVIVYNIFSPTDGETHYSRVIIQESLFKHKHKEVKIIAKTPSGRKRISNVMFVHLPWAFMSLQSNAVTVDVIVRKWWKSNWREVSASLAVGRLCLFLLSPHVPCLWLHFKKLTTIPIIDLGQSIE